MILFKGSTFAEVYQQSLKYLMQNGSTCQARGTTSFELLDVSLEIENPASCLYQNQVRGSKFSYIAAELLWYYSGRNDVAFISQWAKFWEKIQNPDGTANSAYGKLIFKDQNFAKISQFEWAIQSLMLDNGTRQAVMHFNRPDHQHFSNKDFVCTMYANLHIRNNRLYMSVFMRSNDAVWGTPTDIAFFCSLHMQIHSILKKVIPDLELGSYTHVANSYHVYDRHFTLVNSMLESEFSPVSFPPVICDLIEIDGSASSDFNLVFNSLSNGNPIIFQDNDLLKWIFDNYKQPKNNDSGN